MADVDIIVDSGDLKAAIDLLNDYGISFTKMVNQVQTEGNRLTRASKATAAQVEQAWENAQKVLDNSKLEEAARKEQQVLKRRTENWKQYFSQAYMQNQGTGITEKNSALVQMLKEEEAASKRAEKATRELEAEKRRLTAVYNPLLAAEQQYLAIKNEITRSSELGILDIEQETAALNNLEREYQALSKGVYLAGSRFNQFGQMSGIAGKSANRFGMYAQQAGYQIGDFAVQIQSGTNAGVAFSQQFAQLAGLIPGVAGAVTTFAAIGLGLLIQNLTRGKKKAEDFKSVFTDLSSLDDIFESAGASFEDSFISAIDKVEERYGKLVGKISEKRRNESIDTFVQGALKAAPKATPINPAGDPNQGWGSWFMNNLAAGSDTQGLLAEEAAKANVAIDELRSKWEQLRESTSATSGELAKEIRTYAEEILESTKYTEEQKKALLSLLEDMNWDETLTQYIDKQDQQVKKAKELKATLEQEAEMRSLILKYGEDSIQVRQAELDAEHAKTKATIEGLDVSKTLKSELEAAADANYAAESATIAWGNSLGYVKEQIAGIAAILASIGGGIISNVEKFTTAKLIREGRTRVEAEKEVRYAREDREYEARKQSNLAQYGKIVGTAINAALSIDHVGGRNADEALLSAYELDAERTKAAKGSSGRKKGSGGKGKLSDAEKDAEKAAEKLNEFFDQFEIGMEQQARLLGVYGEQREELEKVIEIENRLGEARHLVSQQQIEAMAQEELALERKLQRQQEIYEIGSQNVENLLMSIVNGTSSIEDAFRTMLANIIAEIYQQYVAKGAADVAGKFLVSLFSANGNAFGSGGVKMFAKGGVVDSPTAFRYSGGLGVMGEAGPEAILPLKRNSQGKLGVQMSGGSSGNISIQQHFHISANGDESVRTIIRQEMPNIANAAKAAVIEGKRRNERGL